MKLIHILTCACFLLTVNLLFAQTGDLNGCVIHTNAEYQTPLQVRCYNTTTSKLTSTDSNGCFRFSDLAAGNYTLHLSDGFGDTMKLNYTLAAGEVKTVTIQFEAASASETLYEVTIRADRPVSAASSSYLSQLDFENRPKNSAQDMLRLVPGLFIAQHAGGGKAEQIFVRGFDCDHGTDVASFVDGIPVNMPSHGHGQGYEDLHFLIPETVKGIDLAKGPYQAKDGNFATAASVRFNTFDSLANNLFLVETAVVPTQKNLTSKRFVGMYELPVENKRVHSYFAVDVTNNRSYFEQNQHLNRYNLFSKTVFMINPNNMLSLSFSGFSSSWDASGQIPDRAVKSGLITRFGSIDPTEGGATSRMNVNLVYKAKLKKGDFESQVYTSSYKFRLYSNFTFFLEDSINGDQIEQGDVRTTSGINSSYSVTHKWGSLNNRLTVGASFRADDINNELWRTVKRQRLTNTALADINEVATAFYFNEVIRFSDQLRLELGGRYDYLTFSVEDYIPSDTSRQNYSGFNYQTAFSPKVNFIYSPSSRYQFFMNYGHGFHSNDARSTVQQPGMNQLPLSVGGEVGTLLHLGRTVVISAALWTLNLENELVYVGDAGTTENKGSSRRTGIDASVRWQIFTSLIADADFNVSENYLTESLFGRRNETDYHIPLAPTLTSTGGLTYKFKKINALVRYRYMADRAANEANTVTALGYLIFDGGVNYQQQHFKIGLNVENILNVEWNEAQFDTESRLPGETQSVSEIHYTPGTPFAVKLSIGYLF
ncbi:MAG TPA: TonB-dependent receptor [Fluviicola sp.]|nr:TonB-dependent receptor [Fluviicola sp.]